MKNLVPSLPFVEIHWIDSETASGWDAHTSPKEDLLVVSRGWLIAKNKKYTSLAADWDITNKTSNRVIHIPDVCIKEIFDIEVISEDIISKG